MRVNQADRAIERAADVFGLLSTLTRRRIVCALLATTRERAPRPAWVIRPRSPLEL